MEVWGRQGELCGRYLGKGRQVYVAGRLKTDRRKDKQTGQDRHRVKVVAELVQFLGGGEHHAAHGVRPSAVPSEVAVPVSSAASPAIVEEPPPAADDAPSPTRHPIWTTSSGSRSAGVSRATSDCGCSLWARHSIPGLERVRQAFISRMPERTRQARCRTTCRAADAAEAARDWQPEGSRCDRSGRDFVHQHRVHYDVTPEIFFRGTERLKVGFEVTLWAAHAKGARALPGCGKCVELASVLRDIAEWVVPQDDRPTRIAIEPFHRALYASSTVPGADEVATTIRLVHQNDYDRPIDTCEERCLKEIRARLKELGARER